jgi:alpha-glucosidase
VTATETPEATDAAPWWRRGVVYQVYPRSFADSNGDGVGDLPGIRRHLDHLRWLGVDALWLSPIYRSPMADFGYDVSDHCDVDPVFGSLADADELIAGAHAHGLRILLDWVANHTSDRHPWFVDARSSRASSKRDWYLWRDVTNNWRSAFRGPAWTFDDVSAQWYLHLFLREQPDLNWSNPEVERAQHDVLRFWLDRGVDGFRADVVHLIGKDERLPDQPPELAQVDLVGVYDDARTHPLLRRVRQVLESYGPDRMMVGEVNLAGASLLAPYYGDGDELHLVFDFSLLRAPWSAESWAARIAAAELALASRDAWPAWVLSNHDESRHRTRHGGSEDRARVAAVVLLTLRGTPFLYAGEELGAQDTVVPADRAVDLLGRDRCRAPMPWTAAPGHGWSGTTWLPFEADAPVANVETLRRDESSILWLYRRLLAARRSSDALSIGSWQSLGSGEDGVLEYERQHGHDRRRIIANFGDEPAERAWAGWEIEVGSRRPAGPWNGRVGAEEAVVLRRMA